MMISHSLGTEIALNFKEQANEYFKGKRYREALGFYKQGIDAKPKDKSILEALLCNTAACNLELSAYSFFVLNGMNDFHIARHIRKLRFGAQRLFEGDFYERQVLKSLLSLGAGAVSTGSRGRSYRLLQAVLIFRPW